MTVISTNLDSQAALDAIYADGSNTTVGVASIPGTVIVVTAATSTWSADAGTAFQANQNQCFHLWWTHMRTEYPNHTIETDDIRARFIN